MAEAKSEMLPFAADALHTDAMAAPNGAVSNIGGADYYGLRRAILEVGRSCLTPGSRVLDLRCDLSALMPLVEENEDLCRFVVLSPNEEEGWNCFDRLRTRVRLGFVDVACLDLRQRFPEISARMILALDALGGLSSSRRTEVAEAMHRRLDRGGAVVVLESVEDGVEDAPVHGEVGSPPRRTRCHWCSSEWESFLGQAGFRKMERIWTDGSRVAWLVRK